MEDDGRIMIGLDMQDIAGYVSKKNKRYLAMILQDLEEVLDKDSEEFKEVRRIVLDGFNNYNRSLMRVIFGNTFEL
jgi:hypothetical protein